MDTAPQTYGLNSRVVLQEISEHNIAIVKRIKSRIIRKDAMKIMEMAQLIKTHNANIKVSLICNDNICSKSVKLLSENGINVLIENPTS